MAPGNNQSAGKRRSGRVRRGNSTLRATLAECAHGAVRTHRTQFRNYHQAHKRRRGYKRSILAVAHKMLRTILAMLRDNAPQPDSGIDWQALVVERNASRWLRNLERYGYLEALRAAPAASALDSTTEPPRICGAVAVIERGYPDGLQNPGGIPDINKSLRNARASGSQ